jgi:hypothetical protein
MNTTRLRHRPLWPTLSIPGAHEPVIRDDGIEMDDPLDSTFGVEINESDSEFAWLEWDRAIATMNSAEPKA